MTDKVWTCKLPWCNLPTNSQDHIDRFRRAYLQCLRFQHFQHFQHYRKKAHVWKGKKRLVSSSTSKEARPSPATNQDAESFCFPSLLMLASQTFEGKLAIFWKSGIFKHMNVLPYWTAFWIEHPHLLRNSSFETPTPVGRIPTHSKEP